MLTDIKPLARDRLEALLSAVDRADVALIGDLCLDAYWEADMKLSRLSRETPHYPLPIVEERHAPGGAGNVACNLAALKPRSLSAVGVVGLDWRGDLLVRSLEARGVGCGLVVRLEGQHPLPPSGGLLARKFTAEVPDREVAEVI